MLYNFNTKVRYQHKRNDDDADDIYQKQFLEVYGMNEFNDDEWREKFNELYDNVIKSPLIEKIIEMKSRQLQIPEREGKRREFLEMGFIFLFSYDTFEQLHHVLQDWYQNKLREDSQSFRELIKLIQD